MSEFYTYPAQPFVEPQSYVDPQLFAGKPAVDPFDFDHTELASKAAFEFAHYGQSPTDVVAPHPEQFDAELDSSLAAFDADVFNLPHNFLDTTADLFSQWRSDTPTRGVPSTFTVSSESTYDSGYSDALSSYHSSNSPSSAYNPEEIDAEMQRVLGGMFNNDNNSVYGSDYQPRSTHASVSIPSMGVFGNTTMPPSAYPRGCSSDYEPVTHHRIPTSAASDYYPQSYPVQATVSPATVSTSLSVPSQAPASLGLPSMKSESSSDPKKKYACTHCSRGMSLCLVLLSVVTDFRLTAFARAYNLKTHIATHDPNRSKPFACKHKSCGRAFSRKHDLRRHLVAIHRSDSGSTTSSEAVGVERGQRNRCEDCGKSWVGEDNSQACDCDDVN